MKRTLAIILVFLLSLSLLSCGSSGVLEGEKEYEIESEINSLDIEINAADFKIEYGERLAVTSNLKYLSVKEEGGTLKIVDEAPPHSGYTDAELTIQIPVGKVYERILIDTGAAKLTVDELFAKELYLNIGAGDAEIGYLEASAAASIECGAGAIEVECGSLKDLSLNLGAGEANIGAVLLGESRLECGVGELNLKLFGGEFNYKINAERGIGSITVDGEKMDGSGSYGDGENTVNIKGGIGAINISFD